MTPFAAASSAGRSIARRCCEASVMKYRRVLVLTQAEGDPRAAFAALRALVPAPEHVTVVAHQPTHLFAWLAPAAPPDHGDAAVRRWTTCGSRRGSSHRTWRFASPPSWRSMRSRSWSRRPASTWWRSTRTSESVFRWSRELRKRAGRGRSLPHRGRDGRRTPAGVRRSQCEGALGDGVVPRCPHRGERSAPRCCAVSACLTRTSARFAPSPG